ncbi:thymus-specific serine protease-like [Drosophila innubila]|uniref:thymus-specific serine protease-like n=1 Tax=Drosophila innubila TaxID=198719 RepID=UPI00148DC767|nr:thymus-specific serine protease-like [Drosophila innubila]
MKLKLFLALILAQITNIITSENDLNENEMWIEQKLDHFNDSDTRTWNMRYLSISSFFKPGGPIIINVNAEWSIAVNSPLCGHYYELIEMFNAYAFQTEHRYYGKSRPVENLRAENLEYLSLKQALADLAHFIRHQKATIPAIANSKVILIGCSYAGSMVTYFRKDYPELIDGGWAAGAALTYTLDYADAMVSAGISLRKIGGDNCYDCVEYFSKTYLKHKKSQDAVYTELNAQNLTEHLDNVDEIIATHVQHRNITTMQSICKNITSIQHNDIHGFGKLLELLYSKIPKVGSKTDLDFAEEHVYRQYFYQTCSEFGNFFTTSSQHQPFGNKAPFSSVIAECKTLFGPKYTIDYISSKVDEINNKYGGREPQVDHIYFTKSQDDPWRWTGIIDECATIIPGIGHCHELRARKTNDSPELMAARQKGFDLIREWINGNGTSRETLTKC